MGLAEQLAQWSRDRSRKVGCVVVGPNHEIRATGYNGFPRGIDDSIDGRYERPAKYRWTEHSERNAIYNAARVGVSLEGCRLYVTTLYPCVDCARAIVQTGIASVMCVAPDFCDPVWGEDFRIAQTMFQEAGVVVSHPEQDVLVAG
jgi:dCMP deaminase